MNETILLLISNVLTAIAGWFVGKRKVTAETDNQVLKNLELAISVYSQIINDLKKQANTNPVLAKNITTIIQRIFKEIVRDAKISNNPKLRKDLSSNEVTKMLNEYGVQPLK